MFEMEPARLDFEPPTKPRLVICIDELQMQPFARETIERCGVDRMRAIVHEIRVERQAEQTRCRADLHPSPDRAGNDT